MAPVLEIKDLEKRYTGFALDKISFTLEAGYIMGLIGPNGAGKTTTIKLIMNLLKRDGGEILLFGQDYGNAIEERRIKDRIGFIYEDNFYYEDLTLREMKGLIAPFYSSWDEKTYKNFLSDFGLPETKKIKELSKGMKVKFSLVIALSHNADLLILDEPTSGLDPLIRREVLDLLSALIQDENKAVLFSTHITSDLEKSADFITLLKDGKVVFTTAKDSLLDTYGIVKGPRELLAGERSGLFLGTKENQFGFEGLVKDRIKARDLLGGKVVIEKPSLEDLIYYILRN